MAAPTIAQMITAALGTVAEVLGNPVKYVITNEDNTTSWVTVNAVVGKTDFATLSDNGIILNDTRSRDYVIKVSDLVINSVTIIPARGHQIVQRIGNQLYTFEVSTPVGAASNRKQVYQYFDLSLTSYKIHTVFKGQVPA